MADIYDVLLDEENRDPIVLIDEDGRQISFAQIAVIPYIDKLYCILKPLDKVDDVRDDEAIVFFVEETEECNFLKVETDEVIATKIFEQYYKLLDEN